MRTIVIGGGIAGLASAALLAREGHDVTLLESRSELGGRAGVWSSNGFRFDTGPSWYLMPEVFEHFYRLFGTSAAEQLDLVKLDPGYRVHFQGDQRPVDIRADRAANIRLFERMQHGAGAALGRYLDSATETYDLAVQRFLYSSYESFRPFLVPDVLRRLGRLARLLLQPLDKFVAGYVSDPRLRQILGYPAVFLGSAPNLTPSMYHLMSHLDLADGVLYPRGGFSTLIDSITAIARAEGVRVITGATVTAIRVTDQNAVAGVSYIDDANETMHLDAESGAGHARRHGQNSPVATPLAVLHDRLGKKLRADLRQAPLGAVAGITVCLHAQRD
jgi:phytoene desaturase